MFLLVLSGPCWLCLVLFSVYLFCLVLPRYSLLCSHLSRVALLICPSCILSRGLSLFAVLSRAFLFCLVLSRFVSLFGNLSWSLSCCTLMFRFVSIYFDPSRFAPFVLDVSRSWMWFLLLFLVVPFQFLFDCVISRLVSFFVVFCLCVVFGRFV